MNQNNRAPCTWKKLILLWLFIGLMPCGGALAQGAATGTVEGRVINSVTGEYLENARITINGTTLETFTDSAGRYRLTRVPPGRVTVSAFFTGFPIQTIETVVETGQTVAVDLSLAFERKPADRDSVVKLSEFVVSSSKEMSGAAIAINEQRFAPNLKTIVAADEFGSVQENDLGEFLKFVPGMTINYVGGDVRTISMNGVPADNVPVTVAGFSLASAGATPTSRQVELNNISMNNIARVEAVYTPTPETQGSALAGSVNLIPRSAFDRAKPLFTWSTAIVMRDNDRHFSKTPGPLHEPTRKVHPALEFSYVRPVNDRFGFTLSAGTNRIYMQQDLMRMTWQGARSATNGVAFPDTTPDKPYLTGLTVRDGTKEVSRSSIATTVDYKLSPNDRLSFSLHYSYSNLRFMNRSLNMNITRVAPGSFTPFSTHGDPGAGEIQISQGGRDKSGTTYMPSLTYRHDGPVWKTELGAGLSRSTNHYRHHDKGGANPLLATRPNVTISFDDIFYLRPNVITVTDGTTGAPVDPYRLNSYLLRSNRQNDSDTVDLRRSVLGSVRRDFFGRIPLALKSGFDVSQNIRDARGGIETFTYLGADGVAGTADDNASVVLDEEFSQRVAPYGFPRIEWMNGMEAVQLMRAHPERFPGNETADYTSSVTQSKYANEIISAVYLRGDTHFFDRRLKLVGGVRAEQTNIKAEGELIDRARNFQRDASGKLLTAPNGSPLLRAPANSLAAAKLTNVERGLQVDKEYLRWFPSLNASFNVRENLIARGGYYWSVGRPSFLQYAGSLTLPDTDAPPSTTNRIAVNNAGIKAWTARTTKVAIEYYFERVGLFSVGVFRRDISNFFGNTVFIPTPEFLAIYGLDPAMYGGYEVSTQHNLPTAVRMTGVDINYKQALTFLPHWARGVQVFANASAQRATGAQDAFSGFRQGFIPRSGNWGISLTREKYNLRMNWSYRGRQRRGQLTGRGIEPGSFEWGSKQMKIDVSGEYALTRRIAVFANLSNIHDAPDDTEYTGPSTPAHAQFGLRENYGGVWTFGLKGSF